MRRTIAERRTAFGRINPFVVLCDVTVSVILCLSVTLTVMSRRDPGNSADLLRRLQALQAQHDAAQKKLAKAEKRAAALDRENQQLKADNARLMKEKNQVPPAIVERQTEIKNALAGLGQDVDVVPTFDSLVVRFGERVLFQAGRSELSGAADATLRAFWAQLGPLLRADRGKPGHVVEVQIQGHTDAEGAHRFNLGLARDRAEAVRDRLLSIGGRELRPYLSTAAYAWHRPVEDTGGQQVARNRRIDIRIFFHRPGLEGPQPVVEPRDWNKE